MLTHAIHSCAVPGCPEWTVRRHCEAHETPEEIGMRGMLDTAVVELADAEETYVAAVRADAPTAVVEALQPYRRAAVRVQLLEQRLGMVR